MKNIKITSPKILRLLLVIIILFVLGTGSTYAYLAYSANGGSLTGNMANVNLSLSVTKVLPKTNGVDDIIINEFSNLAESLNNDCSYDSDYALCQLYRINLSNSSNGLSTNVTGSISFENENTPNLSWIVLNNYSSSATYTSSMMGEDFNTASSKFTKFIDNYLLASGSSVSFYILVWVNEVDTVQTDEGAYNATVRFEDANGKGVTATFDGYQFDSSDNDDGVDEVEGYTLFHYNESMQSSLEYGNIFGNGNQKIYRYSEQLIDKNALIGSEIIITARDGTTERTVIYEGSGEYTADIGCLSVSDEQNRMMLGYYSIIFIMDDNDAEYEKGIYLFSGDQEAISDIKIIVPGRQIASYDSSVPPLETIVTTEKVTVGSNDYYTRLRKFSNDVLNPLDMLDGNLIIKTTDLLYNSIVKQELTQQALSNLPIIVSDGTYKYDTNTTLSKGMWLVDTPLDLIGSEVIYLSDIIDEMYALTKKVYEVDSEDVEGYTLLHMHQNTVPLDSYDEVLGTKGQMMYKISDDVYNSDVLIGANLILTSRDGTKETIPITAITDNFKYEGLGALTVNADADTMMLGIWFIMFYGPNNSSGFSPGVWIVFGSETIDTYPSIDIKIVAPGETMLSWKDGSELDKIVMEDSYEVNGGMYDINLLKLSNDDSFVPNDLIGKTAIMKNRSLLKNTVWKQTVDESLSSLFIVSDGTYNFYGQTLSKGVWFADIPINQNGTVLNYSSIIKEWAIMK